MNRRLTLFAALATLLGSFVLYPLFESQTWFWPAAGAVAVVAGTGALVRRFTLPAAVTPLATTVAVVWFGTLAFAQREALFGVLPSPAALGRLGTLLGSGWTDVNRYAAPVPLSPGLTVMTVLGVGLVAVVVDFVAVRLGRAAAAGLPLLALFSVPVAAREDQVGWMAFAFGVAGYLTLLVADSRERIAHWGRAVTGRRVTREQPDSGPLAAAGRRIGLTAVVLAIFVPLLVPSLEARTLFGFGVGSGSGGGGTRTIELPDPVVALRESLTLPNPRTVLRYQTDDANPEYLRQYVLDTLDGQEWRMERTPVAGRQNRVDDDPFPSPPGLSLPSRQVHSEYAMAHEVTGANVLPLPYPTNRLRIEGDWRVVPETLMVISRRDSAAGRRYEVTSLKVDPSPQTLQANAEPPADLTRRFTRWPRGAPGMAEVAREARRIVADAGAENDYTQAIALQNWFTREGGFSYDLNPGRSGETGSPLADFVLVNKKGFCQHFAYAMATMARMLDIPARVAVGYTAGTRVKENQWVVSTNDTHAWPELYFTGVGWLRFEPTPGGQIGQDSASIPRYAVPAPQVGGVPGQPGPGEPGTDPTDPNATPTGDPGRPNPLDRVPELSERFAPLNPEPEPSRWPYAVAAAVLVALVVPRVGRSLVRRRRWLRAGRNGSAAAAAAWRELHDDLTDHGVAWSVSDTPRATARNLAERLELDPERAAAVTRIALAEERARYAPVPVDSAGLANDSARVRRAIAAATSPGARWRARLVPRSVTGALWRRAGRLLEVFDWIDLLTSRVRAVLPRRA